MRFKVSAITPNGPFVAVDYSVPATRGHMSELYDTSAEAQAICDWLNDRDAGYPSLAQYKGGANWPLETWRRDGLLNDWQAGEMQ